MQEISRAVDSDPVEAALDFYDDGAARLDCLVFGGVVLRGRLTFLQVQRANTLRLPAHVVETLRDRLRLLTWRGIPIVQLIKLGQFAVLDVKDHVLEVTVTFKKGSAILFRSAHLLSLVVNT